MYKTVIFYGDIISGKPRIIEYVLPKISDYKFTD